MMLNGISQKTFGMRGLQPVLLRQTIPNCKAPSAPVPRPLHQLTHARRRAAVSESSYLPFLFHNEDEASPPFNGRRSFVKGKAVAPVCVAFSPTPQYAITRLIPAFNTFAATRAGTIIRPSATTCYETRPGLRLGKTRRWSQS